jgi:C4-dicarboxylate-specific signal transduction histidine kinase
MPPHLPGADRALAASRDQRGADRADLRRRHDHRLRNRGGDLYVIVVLLASRFCGMRALLGVAGGCIVLTLLSYFLTHDGNFHTGIINTAISILAIGAVAWLAVRFGQAQARAELAQAQLARVTRITTLGGMGAAIAHEINQPLAAIAANASACRRWVEAAPPRLDRIAATIGDIAEDANRASAIIARVRGLIANAAPRREQADINDTIRQAAALVEPQLRACSVDLRLLLAADLPALMIDPVQIQQVILNLLVNASEAVEPREGDIGVESRLAKGRIIMTVEDNGPGLPEERSPRCSSRSIRPKRAESAWDWRSVARSSKRMAGASAPRCASAG